MNKKKVHIIGAGLAGLSAAIHAGMKGLQPVLYEASGMAGGRCRTYHDETLGMEIDNGNHVLVGANREAFAYLQMLGALDTVEAQPAAVSLFDLSDKRWLQLHYPFMSNLRLRDIMEILKLAFAFERNTVADYFDTSSLWFHQFLKPLTLAVLNTAPEHASARLLRHMLFTLIKAGPAGSRIYLPKHSLAESFVTPALNMLGSSVHYHSRLKALQFEASHVSALCFTNSEIPISSSDAVVLALPANELNRLMPEITAPLEHNSILNAHFQLETNRPLQFFGILNGNAQWVRITPHLISTTTSAADHLVHLDAETLTDLLWEDVSLALGLPATPIPSCRVIKEKAATFAATPANVTSRPDTKTAYANLFIAGDSVNTGLPATIESAILSGRLAAEQAHILMVN